MVIVQVSNADKSVQAHFVKDYATSSRNWLLLAKTKESLQIVKAEINHPPSLYWLHVGFSDLTQ